MKKALGEDELHWAAYCGDVNRLDRLIQQGRSAHTHDHQDRSVLAWAIRGRQKHVVRFLGRYYSHNNSITFEDALDALKLGSKSIIRSLVDMGLNVNRARDTYGNTLLHWATFYNKPHMIIFLLNQCGARCNVYNRNHQTPYDIAVLNQQYHLTFLFRFEMRRKSF